MYTMLPKLNNLLMEIKEETEGLVKVQNTHSDEKDEVTNSINDYFSALNELEEQLVLM